MTAPVGALTQSPPPRSVKGGLVYPAPPEDAKLAAPGFNKLIALYIVALAASGAAAAAIGNPLALMLPVAAVIGFVTLLRRTTRRANAKLGAAGNLVQRRKLDEAEALLTSIARNAGGNRQIHGLSLLQLAGVHALRGDCERSLQLLVVIDKNKSIRRLQTHVAESIPFFIARAFALLGEIDAAEGWLARANKGRNFLQQHTADVTEALLRARQGRHKDAAALLEKHWDLLETSATGDAMKAMRAVLAFCLERIGGQDKAVDDKRIDMLLAGARPFGDELRGVARPWPDLMEFLLRRVPDEVLGDPR